MNISLAAEPLFHLGSMPITNTLMVAWFLILVFIALIIVLRVKKLSLVPKGLQNILETVVEALLNLVQSVAGSRELAIKFFPLVATIFLYVILSNWVEMIPGLGTIGFNEIHHGKLVLIPFIRSSSADLNFTLAIALISVVSTWIMGIRELGLFGHLGKFFNFHGPIDFFVGILELISEFAKIISFSFRLFGNIFAGEVLLAVVAFLVPYLAPVPFLFLELFVGFVQALVFSMLTLVFLKMATTGHAEAEHAHENY